MAVPKIRGRLQTFPLHMPGFTVQWMKLDSAEGCPRDSCFDCSKLKNGISPDHSPNKEPNGGDHQADRRAREVVTDVRDVLTRGGLEVAQEGSREGELPGDYRLPKERPMMECEPTLWLLGTDNLFSRLGWTSCAGESY